ncbi:MAG: M48 family metalloprotease [Alphaproteobacteria bacterium]|nr:M48 family metalloprotease [Alphaproteobacteria bacterium]
MVKIKLIISILLVIFSCNAYSAQKNIIIRDAEIEYFLYKVILTVSDGYFRNTQPFQPVLISNNEYNAFVTGSNKIFINTGLINKSKSINEIQGVLAHEIGHLILNHSSSRSINTSNLSKYSKFATIAGIALSAGGKLDSNSALGLILGTQDIAIKSAFQFSRIQEQQADKYALDTFRKKKISLTGLENLLLRLSQREVSTNNSVVGYYRSHPFSKQRLEQLKKYKSSNYISNKNNEDIYINNFNISLDYIKNKIRAYGSDPFEILNKKDNNNNNNNNIFFTNYSRIIAYKKTGEYEPAIDTLKVLQNKYPDYPFYYELAGDIYFSKGSYNKSIREYKKALNNLNEKYIYADDLIKFSLVKSYLQTNKAQDLEESIQILEQMLHNSPKWKLLWRLLAKSSGKLGQKGITYIALAEESLLKKNFIKAKKYVDLALKQKTITNSYKLRGLDILSRIKTR